MFGKIDKFPNIENMKNTDEINNYISNLADNKIPIFRCTISLSEYDAVRIGYDTQERWKELFESKLVSLADKLNIKYTDIQYCGAVHLESGHPHLQVMVWSKQRDKMNYFINYKKINKMKDEFTNQIFKDDLIELYKQKDNAKKQIIINNEFIQAMKKASSDKNFIKDMLQYEKDFYNKKIMKKNIPNKQIKLIAEDLIKIKKLLKQTKGSIKYQYLKQYPDIVKKVDNLSNKIINMSLECQEQIDKYIKAKQEIVSYKYQSKNKIEQAQEIEKQKAEQEVLKLIGNQILNYERILLNQKHEYNQVRYINESEKLVWRIFNSLYFMSRQEEKYLKKFELKYKKQLSKQAKKELAIKEKNKSSFDWENNM